jgi:hypothetical protein
MCSRAGSVTDAETETAVFQKTGTENRTDILKNRKRKPKPTPKTDTDPALAVKVVKVFA